VKSPGDPFESPGIFNSLDPFETPGDPFESPGDPFEFLLGLSPAPGERLRFVLAATRHEQHGEDEEVVD